MAYRFYHAASGYNASNDVELAHVGSVNDGPTVEYKVGVFSYENKEPRVAIQKYVNGSRRDLGRFPHRIVKALAVLLVRAADECEKHVARWQKLQTPAGQVTQADIDALNALASGKTTVSLKKVPSKLKQIAASKKPTKSPRKAKFGKE